MVILMNKPCNECDMCFKGKMACQECPWCVVGRTVFLQFDDCTGDDE